MDRHRDLHMLSYGEIKNQIWSETLGLKSGLEIEAEAEDWYGRRDLCFSWFAFPFFRGRNGAWPFGEAALKFKIGQRTVNVRSLI